jgi:hydrogenase expression/formation protein HypD
MKYLSEFRAVPPVAPLLQELRGIDLPKRRIVLMEVCGTHTMAIARSGLKKLLPGSVRLISGPGCPVCVSPQSYLDKAIELARRKDCIIATFGDMFRVPGSRSSLEKEKAGGADVRIVYSPLDALAIARSRPERSVVFLSVGFETTTPTIAATVTAAAQGHLRNIFFLCANKLIPPAMKSLLDGGALALDGFLCPGHVSAVIGPRPYREIAEKYAVPCVIAGFEPVDILQAVVMLARQTAEGRTAVEVQYDRIVHSDGNAKARAAVDLVFESTDAQWRGIGTIPESGLKLRKAFKHFDAERMFDISAGPSAEPKGCLCGAVLQGLKEPTDCRRFGTSCTPLNPVGACMVSSEGTCAAYYKYEGTRVTGKGH